MILMLIEPSLVETACFIKLLEKAAARPFDAPIDPERRRSRQKLARSPAQSGRLPAATPREQNRQIAAKSHPARDDFKRQEGGCPDYCVNLRRHISFLD